MEFLPIVLILFLLPVIGRWGARFFGKLEETQQQKELRQENYMRMLIGSVDRIHDTINPPEPEPDYVEALLKSNREIQEKERLALAIQNELGIDINE